MLTIRQCTNADIPWMVALSHNKRANYEKHQKQFWKMSKNSDEIQAKWFAELLKNEEVIALASADKKSFLIGKIITPPEVYDAGLTLIIDDFCIKEESEWETIGRALVIEAKKQAKEKRAAQILIVCGAPDDPKKTFLKKLGLTIASEWYVSEL